jgi:hypothetical protein
MLQRKLLFRDFGLATDGWIAAEPSDALDFENANKKTLRDGEERLMLALLEDAVQCFQEYVIPRRPREERLFQEADGLANFWRYAGRT